jgi:hypothetical protein
MILLAIRIRLPLGTGLAPTIGVGVCLLVLHSGTGEYKKEYEHDQSCPIKFFHSLNPIGLLFNEWFSTEV